MVDVHILGSGNRRRGEIITEIDDVHRINEKYKEEKDFTDSNSRSGDSDANPGRSRFSKYKYAGVRVEDFYKIGDSPVYISRKPIVETKNCDFLSTRLILKQKGLFLPTVKQFTDYILHLKHVHATLHSQFIAPKLKNGQGKIVSNEQVVDEVRKLGLYDSTYSSNMVFTWLDMVLNTNNIINSIIIEIPQGKIPAAFLKENANITYKFNDLGIPTSYALNELTDTVLGYQPPYNSQSACVFSRNHHQIPMLNFNVGLNVINTLGSYGCVSKDALEKVVKKHD